jgi:hypothetical protein
VDLAAILLLKDPSQGLNLVPLVLRVAGNDERGLGVDAEISGRAAREARLNPTGRVEGRVLSGSVVAVHTGAEYSGWWRAGKGARGNEEKVGEEGGT